MIDEQFHIDDLQDIADIEAAAERVETTTEPEPNTGGIHTPGASEVDITRYDIIPQELKDIPQWVAYKLEAGKDGRITKVPYIAMSKYAKRANVAKPDTWSSFANAVNTLTTYKGYEGIGFMLTDADPYMIIDLDHVTDTDGILEPWVFDMVAQIGSYAELSPSKTGVHITLRGMKPGKQCRNDAERFEIYGSKRWMSFTGYHLEGSNTAIVEAQEVVEAIYQRIFTPKQTAAQGVDTGLDTGGFPQCGPSTSTTSYMNAGRKQQGKPLSDSELLNMAMNSEKNGSEFTALMNGDITAHNNNHSAADQAYCNMLAYWSGRDAAQMDRLFRLSGLMRPKWNELRGADTYGQITINKAIEGTARWYSDGRQQVKAAKGDTLVSTRRARSTAGNGNKDPNATDDKPPIKFELSEAMRKVLHGVAAYVPQAFNRDDDPLFLEALEGRRLPLQNAARMYATGMEELLSHEAVFMYGQFKTRHIPDDLLMMIRSEGMEKDPIYTYSIDALMSLDIPEPHFLMVLGECGSTTKLFTKGLSHCITAQPSAGKTHFIAQSAMHWNEQPVIYCTEEGVSTWAYRIRKYLEAGLPNNQQLQIKPCLGEGHKFILDTINAAPEGSIVIVDTLRAFANVEDEASGAQWSFALDPWCGAARKRNITLILIHHSKKGAPGKDPIDNASGSNSLMSRVEQRITINESEGHISVYGKGKNWQITPSHWKRSGDKFVSMTADELRQISDNLTNSVTQRMSAYDIITVKDLFKKLIADGIECEEKSIRTILSRMAKSGEAVNDAITINSDGTHNGANRVGRWRLVTKTLLASVDTEAE